VFLGWEGSHPPLNSMTTSSDGMTRQRTNFILKK